MTLREIANLDCIDGECPLCDKCCENTKVFGMDYCDMARELMKVVEEEERCVRLNISFMK